MPRRDFKYSAELLSAMTDLTARFATDVVALPIPDNPTRLDDVRKQWASGALSEELCEFMDAETLEDEVDALVDLSYFAMGRLVEMGVSPRAVFEEVHEANMRKERGELSKRPGSLGHDAVKPEGWFGPEHEAFLSVGREDILGLWEGMSPAPRILVMGYARHGKDTFCELLADHYGLKFTSSSWFCAERVVMPKVDDLWDRFQGASVTKVDEPPMGRYLTVQECFEDRHHHRKFWFDAITDFNTPDLTRLGRAIFAENDVYCGVRNVEEFQAMKDAGVFDVSVWVDAGDRLPPEDESSCTVYRELADYVVDNNGPEGGLYQQMHDLMAAVSSHEEEVA